MEPRVVNWNLVTKGESGMFAHLVQGNYRVLNIKKKGIMIRVANYLLRAQAWLVYCGLNF